MDKIVTTIFDPKGLDDRAPSTLLDPRFFSSCGNIRISDATIKVRNGTSLLSSSITDPIVSLACYQTFEGAWYLIAFTSTSIYYFNPTTSTFIDITNTPFTGSNFFDTINFRDVLIFTNYQDPIQVWNGTGKVFNLTSFDVKAKCILPFGERLCLYNTKEGGTTYHQRIRWSTPTDYTDFEGEGSGGIDLFTQLGGDEIVSANIIQDMVAVYGNEHIVLQQYVGGNAIFFPAPVVISGGLVSPNAIVAFPHMHIFLGRNNIYAFNGSPSLSPIGDPIKKTLMDTIDMDKWDISFMEYREATNEVVLFYPTKGSNVCDAYFCYNMDTGIWTKGSASYTCGVRYRTTSALTIGQLAGTIGTQLWRIGDALSGVSYPFSAYGKTNGHVVKDDPLATTDDGVAIDAWFHTKDFTSDTIDEYLYFTDLLIEARGTNLGILYSTDEGATWNTISTKSLSSAFSALYQDLYINSKKVRFGFITAAPDDTFEIRRIILKHQLGSSIL